MDEMKLAPLLMKEEQIRPKAVFDNYLSLARADAATLRSGAKDFVEVVCPACESRRIGRVAFKWDYRYVWCEDCGSLYCSPRPGPEQLAEFYRTGESVRSWGSTFYQATAEARREAIIRPRARFVAGLLDGQGEGATVLADIGSGFGLFLEESAKIGRFSRLVGIEPAESLASAARARGYSVIEKYVEDVLAAELQADILTAFEVLEHVFDPSSFIRAAFALVKPRGALLCTTLVSTGFDIAVLGERSKNVYPPHHLNLLSVEGVRRLFERAGFARIRLETPGELDVDILRRARESDPSVPLPAFIDYLIRKRGQEALNDLQAFLKKHCLSSHCRVIGYKHGS